MTGMGGSVNTNSSYVTAQFNTALLQELIVIAVAMLAIAILSTLVLRRQASKALESGFDLPQEPAVRRLLRLGFGVIWVIDGLLQLQPQMPIGLPDNVVTPTAASAPAWVSSLVTFGTDAWLRHPVLAASATVWLQLGLGLWLLVANRGWASRAAGWASAVWALNVWIFGNALGTLFMAPISWTTGAPGAVFFYVLAGVAIGLPPMMLKRQSFSLWVSRVLGLGLAYFAILQAWPGRGFWGGGKDGAYPSMASEMGSVSQPGFSASIQHWFQTFTTNSSWIYNTLVVVVLALAAFGFLSGKVSWMRLGTIVYVAMALVDWVLVQDFAVFGGMGTDLNSMIPSALIVGGAYLLARDAKEVVDLEEIPVVRESRDTRTLRFVGAIAATVVFLVGAVPMLLVGVLPGTSADVAAATGAGVQELNSPAPDFTLIDQQGKRFTLSDYRGKTVVLSFLDPVCTSECPIEAQEMKAASQQLGNNPAVEFVAINSNPLYRSPATLRAFDTAEGLTGWNQWQFLTGTKAQLQTVWDAYGVGVQVLSGGGMVAHAEPIYVINSSGVLTATWTAVAEGSVNSLNSQSAVSLIVSEVQKASK